MISSLFYKDPKLNKLFVHNYICNGVFGIYSNILYSSNIINRIIIENEAIDIINQILDKIDYNECYLSDSSNQTSDKIDYNKCYLSDSSNETFSKTLLSEDELEFTYDGCNNSSIVINSTYFSDEESEKSIDSFELIDYSEINNEVNYDSESSVDSLLGIPRSTFERIGNYLYERAINYKSLK